MLVLPLSTLPLGQCSVGTFPTPTTPCSVTPAALHPGLVDKAALEDREQQQVGRVTHHPLHVPQSGTPEGPWVGFDERVKDAQGNTGLSCLQDPLSVLQWGAAWWYQELGVPAAHTPASRVSHG